MTTTIYKFGGAVVFILTLACSSFVPAFSADSESRLVMFDDEYCSWCRQWDEEIGVIYRFTPEHCQAPLKKIELGETLPDSIALREPVTYTPTFVLVVQGKEVDRIVGYPGEDFFWSMLDDMISNGIPENIREELAVRCENG
ncbi:MAG: hypothetical protein OXI60_06760 [Acidiferrobacterales bacterium]|nr:hypothetical protein [Acidiferrobacterales bacterium]